MSATAAAQGSQITSALMGMAGDLGAGTAMNLDEDINRELQERAQWMLSWGYSAKRIAVDYEMPFAAPVNSLVTLTGRWGSSTVIRRGRRVYDGTLGATGAQAAVDFGAGVLDGGMAFLHVASVTGVAIDADVEVQSSADNNTWVDEGTFTFSDPGGYSLDLTGTIGRYVRLNCTDLGGASGIRCMAVASIDWPRLMRARQAQEIERIELHYPEFFMGKWKPTPAEWRTILRHNRLGEEVSEDV